MEKYRYFWKQLFQRLKRRDQSTPNSNLAGTKHEATVRIPPVRGLRIVRVEPLLIVITIEVEYTRVAIAVSCIYATSSVSLREKVFRQSLRCILCVIENHPTLHTKFFLFLDRAHNTPWKAVTAHVLAVRLPEWFQKAVAT